MNWRKVFRWLASYPLERVRANIALRNRPKREDSPLMAEMKKFYTREMLTATTPRGRISALQATEFRYGSIYDEELVDNNEGGA